MNTFLCYDRCTTCQKAESWLKEHEIPYKKRPIKEDNPDAAELQAWVARSGLPLRRFFNTSGLLYRQLGLKDKLSAMSEAEMLSTLEADGMLVKRPLFISDEVVLVGFHQDEWAHVLLSDKA
ncbi:MAG: arsenate reductase family protein [Oscillospiraceae bacterium]|nr:arsenate reductase family protein [Oscillospiraceae bacterium]